MYHAFDNMCGGIYKPRDVTRVDCDEIKRKFEEHLKVLEAHDPCKGGTFEEMACKKRRLEVFPL